MANHNSRHSGHLNTPRLVADASGTTVWKWEQNEPFGANAADEDPDGNSVAFEMPLRFPGQFFDTETGLHQNNFRDYAPGLGRYVQSDPLGLRAGLNTYLYVAGDPIYAIDPGGLEAQTVGQRIFPVVPAVMGPPAPRWPGSACGPSGDPKNFPNNVGFGNFNQACVNHDACYDECHNFDSMHKLKCDLMIGMDVLKSADLARGGIFAALGQLNTAAVVAGAVIARGTKPYEDAQRVACTERRCQPDGAR